MPMTALIRNLATMTRVGVVAPGSAGTARSSPRSATRSASAAPCAPDRRAGRAPHVRVRPRRRGSRQLEPGRAVVDALDAAFYSRSATSSRRASGCCSRSTSRLDGVRLTSPVSRA
jgi:60 kDa SS-A/Ro ribonucleoprotein